MKKVYFILIVILTMFLISGCAISPGSNKNGNQESNNDHTGNYIDGPWLLVMVGEGTPDETTFGGYEYTLSSGNGSFKYLGNTYGNGFKYSFTGRNQLVVTGTAEEGDFDNSKTGADYYMYEITRQGYTTIMRWKFPNSVNFLTFWKNDTNRILPNVENISGKYSSNDNSVHLFWTSVSGATGYKIYRSMMMFDQYILIGATSATDYIDYGIQEAKDYYYRISSTNSYGEGDKETWTFTKEGKIRLTDNGVYRISSIISNITNVYFFDTQTGISNYISWDCYSSALGKYKADIKVSAYDENSGSYYFKDISSHDKASCLIVPSNNGRIIIEVCGLSDSSLGLYAIRKDLFDQLQLQYGKAIDCTNIASSINIFSPWNIDYSNFANGTCSLNSGYDKYLDHSNYIEMNFTGSIISFWWKVSCASCDNFNFYIDNNKLASINGNIDWNRTNFKFNNGNHTAHWEYINNGGNTGSDCGWLDGVNFSQLFYPTNCYLSNITSNSISIFWNPVDGAEEYHIYRSELSYGIFSNIVTTTGNSFINFGLKPATKYYYKVTAVGNQEESISSDILSTNTLFDYGIFNDVLDINTKSLWDSGGSTNWIIDYSNFISGNSSLRNVKGQSSYIETSFTGCGISFYWKVSCGIYAALSIWIDGNAIDSIGGENNWSYTNFYLQYGYHTIRWIYKDYDFDNTGCGWVDCVKIYSLLAPTNISVGNITSNSIVLSWDPVAGANGYNVYHALSQSGPFQLIYNTPLTNYTDSGLIPSTTYFYQIKSTNQYEESLVSTNYQFTTLDVGWSAILTNISSQNYPSCCNISYTVTIPGVTQVRLHFSTFYIGDYWNYFYINDSFGNHLYSYTGNLGNMASGSVSGDTIRFQFISDGIVNYTDWYIDRIEYK